MNSLSAREVHALPPTIEEPILKRACLEVHADPPAATGPVKKCVESAQVDSDILSFEVKGVIGDGAFGSVLLARCEQNGSVYAMKRMSLDPPKGLELEKQLYLSLIKQEIKALTSNAASAKHFLLALKTWLIVDRYIYLVTDYFNGGDLFDLRSKYPDDRLPEHIVQFYCAEMAVAIGFVHEQGMLHRDIKLENFLISHDGHIVLCDFGLSTWNPTTDLQAGTYDYMAPERLGENEYCTASDWWSLGICTYILLFGCHPMWDYDLSEQENLANIVDYGIPVNEVDYVNNYYAYTFLRDLLVNEPEDRLGYGPNGFEGVLDHPFLFNFDRSKLLNRQLIPPVFPAVTGPEDISYFESNELLSAGIPDRIVTVQRPAK